MTTTPNQLRDRRRGIEYQASSPPPLKVEVDPTENVKALMAASLEAVSEFRASDKELSLSNHSHTRELLALYRSFGGELTTLRSEMATQAERYQEKVARAESARLDSIRQVDREDVAKTAVAANTAIMTLAKQTTDLQQTLAKQVADTAQAQETRNTAQYTDTNKRLSALELSSSEGKGKQTVVDPQMERLTELVGTLARNAATDAGRHTVSDPALVGAMADIKELLKEQASTGGQVKGTTATWAIVVTGVFLIIAVAGFAFTIGGKFIQQMPSPQLATVAPTQQPIIINVPAPVVVPALTPVPPVPK